MAVERDKNVSNEYFYKRVGSCSCPTCNRQYNYQNKDGKMVWAFELEIDERDYGETCKEIADGILECGFCKEPFKVLFDLEKTSRKLTKAERMKYYKKDWGTAVETLGQKTMKKYSTITIVDFDKEKGTILIKDANGNRQRINVLEMIVNNYMLENMSEFSYVKDLFEAKKYIAETQEREAYFAKMAKKEAELEQKSNQKQK